jgi:hypothetical protein
MAKLIITKKQDVKARPAVRLSAEEKLERSTKMLRAIQHLQDLQWEYGYSELRVAHINTLVKARQNLWK